MNQPVPPPAASDLVVAVHHTRDVRRRRQSVPHVLSALCVAGAAAVVSHLLVEGLRAAAAWLDDQLDVDFVVDDDRAWRAVALHVDAWKKEASRGE